MKSIQEQLLGAGLEEKALILNDFLRFFAVNL